MDTDKVERKLTTIMAADVVAYSRMMSVDEEGTLLCLRAYRKIIDGLIGKYAGRIFNTAGDAVMAEFPSAVEGVRCAIAIQEQLTQQNSKLAEDKQMHFRMGINVGDVMIEKGDLFGDGVNVAARLEGIAAPGGICISSSTFEQVKNKLSIAFEDMGPQQVKNIPHPVGAYQINSGPVNISTPDEKVISKTGKPKSMAVAAGLLLLIVIGGYGLWQVYFARPLVLSVSPLYFSTDSMQADDIRDVLNGLNIQGVSNVTGKPFTIRLMNEGLAEVSVGRDGELAGTIMRDSGRWWVEDYHFCMQFSRFAQGKKRCPRIIREGEKLLATRANGETLPWVLSKP